MAAEPLEYKFVTEPSERMKCLICFELARDPKQHEVCGKIFCSDCIEKNGNKPCPNCRTPEPKYFTDRRGYQEIQELPVKCSNVEMGCNWKGTVGTMKNHVSKCEYVSIPCLYGCNDSTGKVCQVVKREMDMHLRECANRPFKCSSCGMQGTHHIITKEHDKVCEKKAITCSKCNILMERRQLSMHLKVTCELAEVPCKFEGIGCKTALKRRDMKKHEVNSEAAHLRLALDTIVSLKKEVSDLKQQFYAHKDEGSTIFSVANFSNKKRTNSHIFSPPFYTSPEGYKIEARVYPNGYSQARGTHISVFILVLSDGSYSDSLSWPFEGVFTVELLNQVADLNHHCYQVSFRGDTTESRGIYDFISHSDLSWNPANNTQYLKDDTLYFRVSPHLMAKEKTPWLSFNAHGSRSKKVSPDMEHSQEDRSLVFKMPSYSLNKSKNKDWYSKPFFSSPRGYMLCLKVYANGDQAGKNSYVSIYLKILNGPYDSFLKWPVRGSVTFGLLNQLEDSNHHKQKCVFKESDNLKQEGARGKIRFLPHSSLYKDDASNTQYLLDDCLYFRAEVNLGELNHKPWLTTAH